MTEVSPFLFDFECGQLSRDNFEEHLPKIITFISDEAGSPNFLQLLNVLFGQISSQLDIHDIDSKLLSYVLPPTRQVFEMSLAEIQNLVEDTDSMEEEIAINISKLLQTCLDILTGYGELINVISREEVNAEHVESVNRHLPTILLEAFTHCKNSEESYGLYFEESTSILTTFFKKTYEIQIKYYKVLEDKVIFTSYGDDLPVLIDVMNQISKIAEMVVSLDVKTAGDQWKVFGKLFTKHAPSIMNSIDVSSPLRLLSSNTRQIVTLLMETKDQSEKAKTKLFKIGNFLLKMIIKLCELSNCDFREGWESLLELLVLLHSCTKTYELDQGFKEELRRVICVAAAPLLNQLLKGDYFYQAFDKLNRSSSEMDKPSKVGLLFLSLAIMKAAVHKKTPESCLEVPFVESVVDLYDSCGLIIDMNSVFDGNDSYSSLVSICAAFMIATWEGSIFAKLENHLVSKLFKDEFHTSIFVSDLLCLVGRLTSDQYCLHVSTYLCQALDSWPNLKVVYPQYKIVVSLVRRLWALLSDESRKVLSDRFNRETGSKVSWFPIESNYKTAVENYRQFCKAPSQSRYVASLTWSSATLVPNGNSYDPNISATATLVTSSIAFVLGRQKSCDDNVWLYRLLWSSLKLITLVLRAVPIDFAQEVFAVLAKMDYSNEEVKEITGMFLVKCSKWLQTVQPTPNLSQDLSTLFIAAFQSANPVIRSYSLQTLSSLKTSPIYNEVISTMADRDKQLLLDLSSPTAITSRCVHSAFNNLPKPHHICSIRSSRLDNVKLDISPPPAKKVKVSDDIDPSILASVHRLRREIEFLKQSETMLPEEVVAQLKVAVRDLNMLC